MSKNNLNILFIDNFDSFVFNLVDEFKKRGCNVEVWRNDIDVSQALKIINKMPHPKLVVLSPGPGTPETAGCCVELLQKTTPDIPFFGVCLGHQSMIVAFGGEVIKAPCVVHGKSSSIDLAGGALYNNIQSPIIAGRYHSLTAGTVPEEFKITARYGEIVMSIEHKDKNLMGVQFHPESILTAMGGKIIENVIEWAKNIGKEKRE